MSHDSPETLDFFPKRINRPPTRRFSHKARAVSETLRSSVFVCDVFEPHAADAYELFLACPLTPLDSVPSGLGPGIYAVYARDDKHPLYHPWVCEFSDIPLYCGKSMDSLTKRLTEHAGSFNLAHLHASSFACRYLVLNKAVWAPSLEEWLIDRYDPLWNNYIKGLGNHVQGKERQGTAASGWDTLHPGRLKSRGEEEKLPGLLKKVADVANGIRSRRGLAYPVRARGFVHLERNSPAMSADAAFKRTPAATQKELFA
ncbi:Eco29kI family restriction endonuclease [Paraburkholderia sp. UCT31]|uniref:Eco29kI family restriction endonuclease n=1 Tax=Paraburkholderia sp. UCT31 TaxID=2615209 RepID=UPI0016551A36|nr:Eco29kI family restriction endonuclease [Paraburkholderia sp. UCT31]MBC8737029.1 Eco29kI family restriction endonuclease [Paraburkholderia sp. UCT31]